MKIRVFAMCLALAVLLCGCGGKDDAETAQGKPGRMVVQLDSAVYPAQEGVGECYTDLTQMNSLLTMLQDLYTSDFSAEQPAVTEASEYWTITATYANGDTRVYTLLEESYLSCGDGRFCTVDAAKAGSLISFLEDIKAA